MRSLAEEVAYPSANLHIARRRPHQLVFQIQRSVAIHRGDDSCDGVRRTVHVEVVHVCIVGREHIAEALAVETERSAVALLVVSGQSAVHVQRPRLVSLLRYDIYHAARGIAAVKRRCGSFHYFYAFHVVHIETCEVHIVHRLAGKPLPVDEEEHALSAESRKVEMSLLVHGV